MLFKIYSTSGAICQDGETLDWDRRMMNHFRICFVLPDGELIKSFTVKLICLNASISFEELSAQGTRSIICTSGTLAPLNAFEKELGIPFDIRETLDHVIDSNKQVIKMSNFRYQLG